jgi:hypothetical protein
MVPFNPQTKWAMKTIEPQNPRKALKVYARTFFSLIAFLIFIKKGIK